ncbi:MAG: hypothetical protein WC692_07615 [Erythrobacter sp.]|jgi:hypothetical protein
MKLARITALASLLMAPAALAAGQQFDLICKGTLKSSSTTGDKSEPFETHLRFDLERGKYCEQKCRALFDIASIQPGSLTLTDKRVDTPSEDSFIRISINRETGEYAGTSAWRTPGRPELNVILKYTGTCEAYPFSGFPDLQTKF